MAAKPSTNNSTNPADLPRQFTTEAQISERRQGRRRLLWAFVISLAALAAFILLGPNIDSVRKQFEYYGAPGEIHIMPNISIENGQDPVRQIPKNLRTPPPPALMEMEPEELSDNALDHVPEKSPDPTNISITDISQPNPDAEVESRELVEMTLPQQSNPDFYLIYSVIPQYPLDASEDERHLPLIFVVVNLFVNPEGKVTDTLIQSTNGSNAYANEVVKSVLQWEFGWRVPRETGGWITTRFNFKSPYYSGLEPRN